MRLKVAVLYRHSSFFKGSLPHFYSHNSRVVEKRYNQSICYHGNCRETKIALTVEEKNERKPIWPINHHSFQQNIQEHSLVYITELGF